MAGFLSFLDRINRIAQDCAGLGNPPGLPRGWLVWRGSLDEFRSLKHTGTSLADGPSEQSNHDGNGGFPRCGRKSSIAWKNGPNIFHSVENEGGELVSEFFASFLKVVEDFGIVGAELVGLQEQIEGVIVAAHLEVDPAEGVEIGGVVGG